MSQPPSRPSARPPSLTAGLPPETPKTEKASRARLSLRRLIRWVGGTRLARAFARRFSRAPRPTMPPQSPPLQQRSASAARAASATRAASSARANMPLPATPLERVLRVSERARTETGFWDSSPHAALLWALDEVERWGARTALSPIQKEHLRDTAAELTSLAGARAAPPAAEVRRQLDVSAQHVAMPDALRDQMLARKAGIVNDGAAAAHTHGFFLDEAEAALATSLAADPPPRALRAAWLAADLVLEDCRREFHLGDGGANAAGNEAWQNFARSLAQDFAHGGGAGLAHLPDVAAFVRAPNYRNFTRMLAKMTDGNDMMKLAVVVAHTELSPRRAAKEAAQQAEMLRNDAKAAGQKFSFLQQTDFCAEHFNASAADADAEPQMAAASFWAARIAAALPEQTDAQGRSYKVSAEDCALGHAMLLASTRRQGLARSLQIVGVVRQHGEPTARLGARQADGTRAPVSSSARAAIVARQSAALGARLGGLEDMAAHAENPDLRARLTNGFPAAFAQARARFAQEIARAK